MCRMCHFSIPFQGRRHITEVQKQPAGEKQQWCIGTRVANLATDRRPFIFEIINLFIYIG